MAVAAATSPVMHHGMLHGQLQARCRGTCQHACNSSTRQSHSGTWCHGPATLATLPSVSSVGAPGRPLELGRLGRTGCGDPGEASLWGLGDSPRCRGVMYARSGDACRPDWDRDAASWALDALMAGRPRRDPLSFRGDGVRASLGVRSRSRSRLERLPLRELRKLFMPHLARVPP